MSWEGYSWLLLKACRPNQQQLVNILQPFQMNLSNNEQQFNAMSTTLRSMGQILEGSSMNIASQLRGNPQQQSFMAQKLEPSAPPPDPWGRNIHGHRHPLARHGNV